MQYDDLSSVDLNDLFDTQNWQEKYRLILHWSALILPKPEIHQENNLLKGCEVSSWIKQITTDDGKRFLFDSQSKVIKGLAAVILVQLDQQTSEFIHYWDDKAFFEKSQFQKYMTPSRNNGLKSLIEFCKS